MTFSAALGNHQSQGREGVVCYTLSAVRYCTMRSDLCKKCTSHFMRQFSFFIYIGNMAAYNRSVSSKQFCHLYERIISLFFFADFNSQYPLYLRQRLVDLVVEGLALLEVVGKEFGGGKNLFLVFGKLALVEIAIQLQ